MIAINAIKRASAGHVIPGTDYQGNLSQVQTNGNDSLYMVLRGGKVGSRIAPNYSHVQLVDTIATMRKAGLNPAVIVDCNHDNSNKNPIEQPHILQTVMRNAHEGLPQVIGAMMETWYETGNRSFGYPLKEGDVLSTKYSITDPCLGMLETRAAIQSVKKYARK